jgi:hypothetical protein
MLMKLTPGRFVLQKAKYATKWLRVNYPFRLHISTSLNVKMKKEMPNATYPSVKII